MIRHLAAGGCLALVSFAAGCGSDFDRAAARERSGAALTAARHFERFAARRPADRRAPEALLRAARIYLYVFDRCPEAQPLLERAARGYPDSPWAEQARRALLDCPEYFPLRPGSSWVFVDSQTGGRNMRLELFLAGSGGAGARADIGGAYFAGKTRFQSYRRSYAKEGWAVWETEGKDRVAILRYPFRKGTSWTGKRGGRAVSLSIDADHETVRVRGGTFHDCIKVREAQAGLPAWRYDYYAPGIGRVRTTVAGPRFEKPNTELKSAKIPPPSFPVAGAAGTDTKP